MVVSGVSPSQDGDLVTNEGYIIPLGKVTTQLPTGTQYGVNNLEQVCLNNSALFGFDSNEISQKFLPEFCIVFKSFLKV